MTTDPQQEEIGIVGGTGPQGRGLARRLADAGHRVVIGSRTPERAEEAAVRCRDGSAGNGSITGGRNEDAAEADLVIVTVPYDGHSEMLTALAPALAGKIVVDCVNPLGFDRQGPYPLPVSAGSAAQEAQQIRPDATVIGAFHHVSAVRLENPEIDKFDEDVLVLGEVREAVERVCALVAAALPGARGIYAGRLRNAGQVESLTANLIAVNRRYQAHAGLKITDLP